PLPAAELHRLGTNDAADGGSAEKVIQHIEANVPPGSTHRDRISKPPQLYSSTSGASARVTVVSVTCSAGAPTVGSFTVAPTVPRLPSASKGAHSRRCAGSVSACQTFSGEWRSSLTRMSVHFSALRNHLSGGSCPRTAPAGARRRALVTGHGSAPAG